jgi:hypothetical protein
MGMIVGNPKNWNKKEPVVGLEPTAGRLRSDYSTTELHRLADVNDYTCGTRCCQAFCLLCLRFYEPQ